MVLGFKNQFVEKILNGTKIHTIRIDKHRRWQEGKTIHFATGVRSKNYKQFKEGVCTGIQAVELYPESRSIYIGFDGGMNLIDSSLNVELARNDGFETEDELWEWFNEPFSGVIIHWTDGVYK